MILSVSRQCRIMNFNPYSVHMSIGVSVCLSVSLSLSLCVCVCVCVGGWVGGRLCLCLCLFSVCVSVCLCVFACVRVRARACVFVCSFVQKCFCFILSLIYSYHIVFKPKVWSTTLGKQQATTIPPVLLSLRWPEGSVAMKPGIPKNVVV